MTRAMWKGVIRFGSHRIPIRLYAAAQDAAIRFRLLHRKDRTPVEQRLVHPETGDEVPAGEIRRGAEFERGSFVVLSDHDLETLVPVPSREIEVLRLVASERIHPEWYDRPYYLGPDGDDRAYGSLASVLEDRRQEAVVRWVMRKKEHVGAILVHEGFLALVTLRFADEVVRAEEIEAPAAGDLKEAEVRMAGELISALDRKFEPGEFHSRYLQELRSLLEKKARGQRLRLPKPRTKPETESLERALKTSLAAARRRRHG